MFLFAQGTVPYYETREARSGEHCTDPLSPSVAKRPRYPPIAQKTLRCPQACRTVQPTSTSKSSMTVQRIQSTVPDPYFAALTPEEQRGEEERKEQGDGVRSRKISES